MDTQHLKAFLSVAQHHSFTAAAQQLHLTQPAISKRISALESQLNCRLFDRIGRSISLTEAGLALLPQAQRIMQAVTDTELALSNLSGEVRGPLRLATSHHIGLHHLPRVLKRFTQDYPHVKLELEFIDSEQAYESLQQGQCELALVTLSETIEHEHPSLCASPLWHDPLDIVAACDHPLAQHTTVSLQQLSAYPAILPSSSTHTTQLVQALFAQAQIELTPSMATNYLETIKMMVSIGLGWSALPQTMTGTGFSEDLVILQVPGLQLSRTLGYLSHGNRTLSNAAHHFIDALLASRNL